MAALSFPAGIRPYRAGDTETFFVAHAAGNCCCPVRRDSLEIVEQREMKDTGASDLSPESGNKPSGGIFVFHYLFRRGKPWYTEFKVINQEVPL